MEVSLVCQSSASRHTGVGWSLHGDYGTARPTRRRRWRRELGIRPRSNPLASHRPDQAATSADVTNGGRRFLPLEYDLAHSPTPGRRSNLSRFCGRAPRSMNYAGERSSQQRLPTRDRGKEGEKDHCEPPPNLGSSDNITAVNGLKGIRSSHVVAGAIVITTDFPSYVIKLTIMTDGKTSCLANFDYQLKDGNLLFDSGDGRFNSDVHAENVSCSIRAIEN